MNDRAPNGTAYDVEITPTIKKRYREIDLRPRRETTIAQDLARGIYPASGEPITPIPSPRSVPGPRLQPMTEAQIRDMMRPSDPSAGRRDPAASIQRTEKGTSRT